MNLFQGLPILGWAIDDWNTFNEANISVNRNFKLDEYLEDYKNQSFNNNIDLLFSSASIPINLGGETEKSKLITTDKPIGIFDFSLASRGLYRVPEYYSKELADNYPNKFIETGMPSGVVPVNLIKDKNINGNKIFYYEDSDGIFNCIIRQKGDTAIDNGVPHAKKEFATRTKKVYLTFKRNRGKVKYVEIYSLFYYTNIESDIGAAIRHIPALMVADYLESIGIKVRFYMTRFVMLYKENLRLKNKDKNGNKLPLFSEVPQTSTSHKYNIFIQPIISKDFGEEFDKPLAFMISSRYFDKIYENMANYALKQETTNYSEIYGNPARDARTNTPFENKDYFEGFERYTNKYQEYVKKGFFKSKEVLPEAMLFFHDVVIRDKMTNFLSEIKLFFNTRNEAEVLINININPFFNWWMRLSASNLKNKIELINSNELKKDFANIIKDLEKLIDELPIIISNVDPKIERYSDYLSEYLKNLGKILLEEYKIVNNSGQLDLNTYIKSITDEITLYADNICYETPKETKEKKDELVNSILTELLNYSNENTSN